VRRIEAERIWHSKSAYVAQARLGWWRGRGRGKGGVRAERRRPGPGGLDDGGGGSFTASVAYGGRGPGTVEEQTGRRPPPPRERPAAGLENERQQPIAPKGGAGSSRRSDPNENPSPRNAFRGFLSFSLHWISKNGEERMYATVFEGSSQRKTARHKMATFFCAMRPARGGEVHGAGRVRGRIEVRSLRSKRIQPSND